MCNSALLASSTLSGHTTERIFSLQWDYELVSHIRGRIRIMFFMYVFIYTCLTAAHDPSFNIISFRAIAFLSYPPTPVYSFIFTPGLCRTDMGVFLALGYEDMPVQASIRLLVLALGRPNHCLRHVYALICVCDVCIRVC